MGPGDILYSVDYGCIDSDLSFFWVVTSSLKTNADLARASYLLPSEIFMGHYKEALQSDLLKYFLTVWLLQLVFYSF